MQTLKNQKLYWLGANVVLVNKTSDGNCDIHRLDGRENYRLCRDGSLWPMKWSQDEWQVAGATSQWTGNDLQLLTDEERAQYGECDFLIMPSGAMVPVATLFPGIARNNDAYRPRILWVDDHVDRWKDRASRTLDGFGIDCVFSDNDDGALGLLEDPSQRFDLITQDLQRPPGRCLHGIDTMDGELTGLSFYERCVRKVRPELPCIFVTAVANDPVVQGAVAELGHCRAVSKPWDWFILVQAIRELV